MCAIAHGDGRHDAVPSVRIVMSSGLGPCRPAYSETDSGVRASSRAAISSIGRTRPRKYQSEASEPGTAHARFLGHDQRALQARSHGLQLVEGDALAAEPVDLGQHHIEGLLRPVGGRAGVAEDGGPIELALVAGVDGVAQPAFLADFGEEPGRGIAAQDRRGGACAVIVGAGDRRRRVGQGDLDLLGLAEEMIAGGPAGPLAERAARAAASSRRTAGRPRRAAGASRSRRPRPGSPRWAGRSPARNRRSWSGVSDGDALRCPRRGPAPRVGEMAAPQLVDDLRARVVLEAAQVLQAQSPDRLDLVVVEVGAEHHVGEDLQGRLEIAAQRRRRQRGVQRLGAFRVADAQIVERRQELAAVARAGPREIHSAAIVAAPPPRFSPPAPS